MAVGIITGTGTYALADFQKPQTLTVQTPFGEASVTKGWYANVEALHISRHGEGHVRLSNQVTHRANIWALKELGASAVVGCTACGAVDAKLELGSIVVFDDLHFAANRLPEGDLCTFFLQPGDRLRGHWILQGGPFSEGVRKALVEGARRAEHPVRDGGTYGHVDGPRFNTPSEIRQLAGCGVSAVSQTAGPEVVLCGELELPYGLMGFVTDYANEVRPGEPTAIETLIALMASSTTIFADVLRHSLPTLAEGPPEPTGVVYRFDAGK